MNVNNNEDVSIAKDDGGTPAPAGSEITNEGIKKITDATQNTFKPLTEKKIKLANGWKSYLEREGASPMFLASLEVTEESQKSLGIRTPSGLFIVIDISKYHNTMPGKGPFVRCSHQLIANGPSLPISIPVEIMIDVDAGLDQIDFAAEETKTFDYIRYQCYTALGQNLALNDRLVISANAEFLCYKWRDKELCIMCAQTGKIYFDDDVNSRKAIFHEHVNKTRLFNPVNATPQNIDYALAKLFGVYLLPGETIPPDEVVPETIKEYEIIIDPVNEIAQNSLNRPKFVRTRYGIIAYGTDAGIGYKPENEDSVVVNSEQDCFAVVDGMGGEAHGKEASEILAQKLYEGFNAGSSFEEIQRQAHLTIQAEQWYDSGACYIAARIVGTELKIGQAGDVKLMVINEYGVIKFQTANEGFGGSVANAVSGRKQGCTTLNSVNLAVGDRIVVGSDGFFDNVSPQEIITFTHGKTIQEAIQILNQEAKKKMQDPKSYLAQGLPAKPDNISIVIYDIENWNKG